MRLVSYLGLDDAGTAVLVDGRLIPVMDGYLTGPDLEPESLDDLRNRAATLAGATGIALADVRTIAPIPVPGKVICVGLNYREHVSEGGRPAPARPLLFSKFSNAVIADGDDIVRPEGTHALDLEVELGVVIGTTAHRVSRADALDHVGQWLRAKGSDTFLPMGAVFVTADEIPDPQTLRLRSWRIPGSGPDAGRDQLMQDGTTADMIWTVAELIEHISRSITLDPGDVIATGTPAGVGVFRDPPVYLEPGDRVRCEIDGIGAVENAVIDWTEDDDDTDDALDAD